MELLLAVACTLEIGFAAPGYEARWDRECRLMWSIHQRASEKTDKPLMRVVADYVSGLKCRRRKCDTVRMRMWRSMRMEGSQPAGWDAKAGSWDALYKPAWLHRVQLAREFLVDRAWPEDARRGCKLARHYGGKCAATGACDTVPSCWKLADCGPTQQAYWVVPARCVGSGVIDAVQAAGRR